MENLKLYYYVNVNSSNQVFAEIKSNNFSEIKVKNALANKAVEIFLSNFSSEELKNITNEDIKKLKSSFKKNTFDTCHLDIDKNLIEVTGNFEKAEAKTETIEVLMKDGTTQKREAIKLHSKVLNDNIYVEKRVIEGIDNKTFNRYDILYKGMLITTMKTKNIKSIDSELERINNITNIKETFENKLNEVNNNKVETEITNNTIVENKEVKYIVKDTVNNRSFKPELIGRMFVGIVSGEYTGLQVENNKIWFLSEDVMEVNPSNTSNIEKEIKQSKIKINILDNKINRLLDKRDAIKIEVEKQKIKYNDKNSPLIQQLFKLDDETDIICNKIDRLRVYINSLKGILYNISLKHLKSEYGTNKYKIINRINNTITYSNDIDKYINNFNYNIKVLIDNHEYTKQQYYHKNLRHKHYFCDTVSYLNDSLKVIYYDKNDTIAKIKKYYHIDWNNNILLIEEIFKKNHTRVHYMQCIAGTYISVNYLSIDKISDELYNDTIKLFKDNIIVTNMLESAYNKHKEYLKNYRQPTFNDKKEIYLYHYKKIINKFPKLKKVAENLKYYSDLYSNNIYKFYRDFKTNRENWCNYLYNYNELNRLLKLNYNINEYDFKSPAKVVYTRNYRKQFK